MKTLRFVFIIAYLTLLCLYFFSETSGNFKRRAANKIALAVLFEAYAVSAYLLHSPLFTMRMILPIGLFFAFLGDILLLWSFVRGGICFSIGNFCLLFYEIFLFRRENVSFRVLIPAAMIFLLFWGTTMLLYQKEFIDFSSVRVFPAYLFSVSLHGSLGAELAAVCPIPGIRLFGAGVFLMMISDYILSVHKFKHGANWILRCNSASYFIGTLLAALSLSLPV